MKSFNLNNIKMFQLIYFRRKIHFSDLKKINLLTLAKKKIIVNQDAKILSKT